MEIIIILEAIELQLDGLEKSRNLIIGVSKRNIATAVFLFWCELFSVFRE